MDLNQAVGEEDTVTDMTYVNLADYSTDNRGSRAVPAELPFFHFSRMD
jgi:hypothetical protein